jgi:hypothetical protein
MYRSCVVEIHYGTSLLLFERYRCMTISTKQLRNYGTGTMTMSTTQLRYMLPLERYRCNDYFYYATKVHVTLGKMLLQPRQTQVSGVLAFFNQTYCHTSCFASREMFDCLKLKHQTSGVVLVAET